MQPYNSYMTGYQNMAYPQYQQAFQPQMPQGQAVQQPAQPQIQNGGFISVRSEMEARNYPIAPGNSVTFKDENQPFVYVKTMGFSQLDRPVFERFRLVKEEDMPQQPVNAPESGIQQQAANDTTTSLKNEIDALRASYGELKEEFEKFKANYKNSRPTAELTKESDSE